MGRNPNSDNMQGLLLDDWLSIDKPKQKLFERLLPEIRRGTWDVVAGR
ncbi:hypothetical protein IQ235_03810 [Oscillatoriales cyanobacterium LEGE 11467]|uniref:Uncharacterized protein n=1 Tax=Zarconia navalis LEGE 11467 TaxID=1828826 RepID=A0A928VWA7_9CYAN|nr:hypothetical protein [Zarconia navalis]MBE9039917.1 hypothetical protein [Zarconia navalis LEGE 11467]